MAESAPRMLILGAHPDDAEFHAGGLASRHAELGHPVKIVSVTNGAAGHHQRSADELATLRRQEAAAAGRVIHASYVTWDFPDGSLQPTLEVRRQVIREIRTFQPDLVLTHRPCDYHPDHRAVGQVVQDASYMVTVPLVVPEVPILKRDPVVAYMPDTFTRPNPLRLDVVLDVSRHLDTILEMLACHRSQVFEFLPYNAGMDAEVPSDEAGQLTWLRQWYLARIRRRIERFRPALAQTVGDTAADQALLIEAYEISEYASALDDTQRERLFPCA